VDELSPVWQGIIALAVGLGTALGSALYAARKGIRLFSGGVSHEEFTRLEGKVDAIRRDVEEVHDTIASQLATMDKDITVMKVRQEHLRDQIDRRRNPR
jgi:hypothetical protein